MAYSLAQDPAYLAFVRAAGLSEQVAAADVARRQAATKLALGIQTDDLNAAGERERQGVRGSQESRGVFRSGQTQQRLTEQEDQQARRQSALELAAATQLGDAQSGLESAIAAQQLRGAELGLSLSQNAALQSGNAALDAAYSAPAQPAYQINPAIPTATAAPKPKQPNPYRLPSPSSPRRTF